MGLDIDDPEFGGEQNIALDMIFSMKALAFCQKSISEIERFDAYFDQLEQNPSVQATLKSEVSRLNDMKSCD